MSCNIEYISPWVDIASTAVLTVTLIAIAIQAHSQVKKSKADAIFHLWDRMTGLGRIPTNQNVKRKSITALANALEFLAMARINNIVDAKTFDRSYENNFQTHYNDLIATQCKDNIPIEETLKDMPYAVELHAIYELRKHKKMIKSIRKRHRN